MKPVTFYILLATIAGVAMLAVQTSLMISDLRDKIQQANSKVANLSNELTAEKKLRRALYSQNRKDFQTINIKLDSLETMIKNPEPASEDAEISELSEPRHEPAPRRRGIYRSPPLSYRSMTIFRGECTSCF